MDEQQPIFDKDTDKQHIARPRPVSYDMCARLNALINPAWSSVRIYIKTTDTVYPAVVYSIVPSSRPGFVIVKCNTVLHGDMLLEVGAGHSFDLRLQI